MRTHHEVTLMEAEMDYYCYHYELHFIEYPLPGSVGRRCCHSSCSLFIVVASGKRREMVEQRFGSVTAIGARDKMRRDLCVIVFAYQ